MTVHVFDCHSDMFINVTKKRQEGMNHVIGSCHWPQLQSGGVGAMLCCTWIDPPYATKNPMERMLEILGNVSDELNEAHDVAEVARCADDIERIRRDGKLAILWGMEGLSGLHGNVSFLTALYRLGVRHAMLTWNEENEFATGVGSLHTDRGVTEKGVEALKHMERLGMLVDVSHANERTFWDVYEHTEKPFIASHSNAYALCPNARNLKDDQIKAIASRHGVIGMNAWPVFIDGNAPSVERLADHVDYIVNLAGIESVACGFDFCDYLDDVCMSFSAEDDMEETKGLANAAEVPLFMDALKRRGYSDDDIKKIAFGNMMRVLKEVLK